MTNTSADPQNLRAFSLLAGTWHLKRQTSVGLSAEGRADFRASAPNRLDYLEQGHHLLVNIRDQFL